MPCKAMMKFTTVNGWRKSTVSLLPVVFVLPSKLTGDGCILVFAVVLYASSALRPLAILAGTVWDQAHQWCRCRWMPVG
ncbi:hypothetical protein [Shewanella algae]|uniref:hypothetical protein n=1 Tax=Shewanella algae TaxID=38313 RepID=UPI00214A9BFE|nr:hypothetical protein [Shewanella algae]